MFRSIATLGLLLSLAVTTAALGGVYVAPSGGYDLFYDADTGARPDEMTPAWFRDSYQTTNPAGSSYSAVQTDALTGENTLFMDQSGTGGSKAARYNLTVPPGSGTTGDEITMDFRFRLLDAGQPDSTAQLAVGVNRPPVGSGVTRQIYYTKFSEDGVAYYNGSSLQTAATSIDTDWHDARWTIDVPAGTASFYLDRATTPLFTHQRWQRNDVNYNLIEVGDGSSSIWGEAQLSYVGWTNSELAPVIPGSLHQGKKRPDTREGFTVGQTNNGAGITTQPGVEAGGVEYWEIIDTGQALYHYVDALDTAELDDPSGWTATAKVRLLSSSTHRYASFMTVMDGGDRWTLTLDEDAVWCQSESGYTKLLDMDTTDAYHTYQLLHDPAADSTKVIVDGETVTWLTRDDVFNSSSAEFAWGTWNTYSSSQARWNLARFQVGQHPIPEPSTLAIMAGLGGFLALLVRRRRRTAA